MKKNEIFEEMNYMKNIPYRNAIGGLSYLARITRPDIQYATFYAARYQSDPGKAHWQTPKRTLRYLKGTQEHKLQADRNAPFIEIKCDSDHLGDPNEQKSTTGYIIAMKNIPILTKSRLQGMTAKSSTEAEIIALCDCVEDTIWCVNALEEFGYKVQPTIRVDNKPAIQTVERNQLTKGNKHIAKRYHFVKDYLKNEQIKITHIPTDENTADMLTKPLQKTKLRKFVQHLMCTDRKHK